MTRPADMTQARDLVISNIKVAKDDVRGRLESGDRDWAALRKSLETYIDLQTAADVLSGQEAMERR